MFSERFFVQPSIGVNYEHIELSLASRLVYLELKQEQSSQSAFFVEPVGTLKVGSKRIKAVSQLGLSLPLNEEEVNFYYQPFLMSIGLHVSLNPMKAKTP